MFSAVIVSTLGLVITTGGFPTVVRLGDAALEFYSRAISDWGQHLMEKLDPTYPRCF
jgi:predicted DNA-binding transcriptional regulator AlpA